MAHIHLQHNHQEGESCAVQFRHGQLLYKKIDLMRYMEEARDAGRKLNKEDIELQVINQLLHEERKNAVDEEQEGPQFYGASLIRTKQGQYFLTHNAYLGGESTSRRCAESNGVEEADQVEGSQLEIADIWFMGGRGNKQEGIMLYPQEYGKIYTPCGHCLQLISNKQIKADGETKVHMIPANEADILLSYASADVTLENRKDGQVMTRTIEQLLPQARPLLNDSDGKIKAAMIKSWEAMKQGTSGLEPWNDADVSRRLRNMHTFHVDETDHNLRAIHTLMMQKVQGLMNLYQETAKEFSLVLARTTDNHYFIGVQVVGSKIQSSPHALQDVISNALGGLTPIKKGDVLEDKKFTDVFLMHVNQEELSALKEANKDADISLYKPTGDALDRLNKRRPSKEMKGMFGDVVGGNAAPKMHFLLPVLPHDFKREKHCVTMDLRDFMTMPFASPKTQEAIKPEKIVETQNLGIETPQERAQQHTQH